MSVLINPTSRYNVKESSQSDLWYACVKSMEQVTERELALRATEEVTLSPLELEMAFYQGQKQLIYALLDGKTVKLRDLGTFYLTCNSEGVQSREEVTGALIKKLNIRFLPTPELKAKLKKATFRRIESMLPSSKSKSKL